MPFSSAAVIAVAAFAALGGFQFLNTLYLQDVRGLSPLHAGLDTLPMAAMTMLFPPLSGRIVGRQGGRIPPGHRWPGSQRLLPHAGQVEPNGPRSHGCSPPTWSSGPGSALRTRRSPMPRFRGCPVPRRASPRRIASTSRQIGQTLGVARVGSLVSVSLRDAEPLELALASRAGWWALTGCGAALLLLGLAATSRCPGHCPAHG